MSSSNPKAALRMSSTARSLAAAVVPQATSITRSACVAGRPAFRTSYSRFPSGWIQSRSGRGSGVPSGCTARASTSRHTAWSGRATSGMWNSRGILQPTVGKTPDGACRVACTSPSALRVSWTVTGWGRRPDCAQSGSDAASVEVAVTVAGTASSRTNEIKNVLANRRGCGGR